jgi:hypothetical protein
MHKAWPLSVALHAPEILAGFAPFRTAHINRFGDYTLDFRRKIGPLNFDANIIPMKS